MHEQLQQRRAEGAAHVRTSFAPVRAGAGDLHVAMGQRLNEHPALGQLCRTFVRDHHALFDLLDPAGIEQTLIQIGSERAAEVVVAETCAQQ